MSKIMQGKWNHSKKPSEYEVFDSDGELLYSGAFVDAMKYMEENKVEIMDDYDAGYAKGYRDGEEAGWENGHECGTGHGFDDGMSHSQENLSKKFEKGMRANAKKLISFYKGILWVFTSDTLPTEDNAW